MKTIISLSNLYSFKLFTGFFTSSFRSNILYLQHIVFERRKIKAWHGYISYLNSIMYYNISIRKNIFVKKYKQSNQYVYIIYIVHVVSGLSRSLPSRKDYCSSKLVYRDRRQLIWLNTKLWNKIFMYSSGLVYV